MKMMLYMISSFLGFTVSIQASLVQIDQGVLNGTVLKSRGGHEYFAFYSIPYAEPPPPKLPAPSWEGIRDATKEAPYCPQSNAWNRKDYFGSEDCLFVQVFTQNTKPEKPKPVLVYIHGGGFRIGGATMYKEYFIMDKPVVFVTLNYRLGVLGLFSTGDSLFPGNYGLKDQVAALQWIQKNIHSFGGDPSSVTIMGNSAGGASVHYHTLSSSSTDLFHRAIMQSGVANWRWAFSSMRHAKRIALDFMLHTNCSRSSTNESVSCLQDLPAEKLEDFQSTFLPNKTWLKFSPVIDGDFITADPRELSYVKPTKPIIIGFTSNEVSYKPAYYKTYLANLTEEIAFNAELPKKLRYEVLNDPELTQNLTTLIKQLYYNNDTSNTVNDLMTSTLLSDREVRMDIADAMMNYPGVEYAYEFDYRYLPSHKELGVPHEAELELLVPTKPISSDEHDRAVSEAMITYWTNFAISGDPNIPDDKLSTKWISVVNNSEPCSLLISNNGFQMRKGFLNGKDEVVPYFSKIQKLLEPTSAL